MISSSSDAERESNVSERGHCIARVNELSGDYRSIASITRCNFLLTSSAVASSPDVLHSPHRSHRVNGRNNAGTLFAFIHDHVTREHSVRCRFRLKRFGTHLADCRRPGSLILAEVHVEFPLERVFHIDLRQNSESSCFSSSVTF